jgi:dihydroorotate dehydrogenase electron transfer subunit
MSVFQCVESCCVQKNSQVGSDSFEMILAAPKIAATAEPGQFVMVSCARPPGRTPLLRRPLSIHDVNGDTISLLYRVMGEGTAMLSGFAENDFVSVLGPLGNGFVLGQTKQHCLVGGGIGIAPLLFLARKIKSFQGEVKVLAGARTEHELLALEKFQSLGTVSVATDDGSKGHHGFVTELLDRRSEQDLTVYVCGPAPMMKVTAVLAKKHGWPCQVSLEAHMACGVGACLGCAVERNTLAGGLEYVHVCKDGPVFKAEMIWA